MVGAIVVVDQVTKAYVEKLLGIGEQISFLGKVVSITRVRNPGAAFGIFANQTAFFIVTGLIVALFAAAHIQRLGTGSGLLRIGLAASLGGALGNLIDRLRLGCVVDFIDIGVWPVFNLADVAIVAGGAIVFLGVLKLPNQEEE